MSNAKDNVLPKWLQLGDGIATVALSRASQANGIQVDKLTLREPTVREMRSATLQGGSNEEEQEMVLFCSLASIGRGDLEGLLTVSYTHLTLPTICSV